MSNDELLSKTITFLRFPMIVLVVFIHTNLGGVILNGASMVNISELPIYRAVHHFVTEELADTAVPMFFFFSGFLFFYKSEFNKKIYLNKLGKRLKTLLIPYIFWNLLVLALTFIHQSLSPAHLPGPGMLIADFNLTDWLTVFWTYGDTNMPICYQFWFIRDLMVVILFSPIIYYFIRYCKCVGLIAFSAIWIFDIWFDIQGFGSVPFYFFYIGAYFSIRKINFATAFYKIRHYSIMLYIGLLALDSLLQYHEHSLIYVHNTAIILGSISIIAWTSALLHKKTPSICPTVLTGTFFVYACHGILVMALIKSYVKILYPLNDLTATLGYFTIPAFVVCITIGVYSIMSKYFPKFTAIITGGRSI